MISVSPEQLQDPVVAELFRADYDDLLGSQISGTAFLEFKEHAHSQAAGSVLAASVFEIVRSTQEQMGEHNAVPSGKRQVLIHAAKIATQVEDLDRFFRDDTKADDIALLTEEGLDGSLHRGTIPVMHLVVAGGSWIEHHASENHDGRGDRYHIEPRIMHGVQSPSIHHGWSSSWLQGSRNYFSAKDTDEYKGRFGYMPCPRYQQLGQGTYWPPNSHLPSITQGREAVIELYDRLLEQDYRESYSADRFCRPSFTLFRQAHFLQDPAAATMSDLAKEKHVLENWQNQMIDDEAISVVAALEQLAKQGKKLSDLEDPRRYFFGGLSLREMEAEWLNLDRRQLILRARFHAGQLGIAASQEDIEEGLSYSLNI